MIKDVQEFLFCICSVFIHVFKHIKDVFNQMELTYSKIQIEKYNTMYNEILFKVQLLFTEMNKLTKTNEMICVSQW